MPRLLFVAVFSLVAGGLTFAAEPERPKIGATIADLRFKDIRYLPRSLEDLGDHKAIVLVFTNTTCPLVQKYWPKLRRLDEEYRGQGVQFVAINVGADDEFQEVAQQAIDFGIAFPFVKDTTGACVAALGVERTPEVAVLDENRKLRYRGRIDDQQRLGGARPDVTEDSLKLALDDLLAGREVAIAQTPVDGCLITRPQFTPPKEPVLFYEHVAPLLAKHCQECHHRGGESPFSLVTLEEVAAQAEMIAEVVADRRMPPWYASRQYRFKNERGLTAAERETIVAWVKTGRAAGDESKAPPPRTFSNSKWEIGEPDLVTTALETHSLPADGFVDYKYVILPHVFWQDTWISAAEILPSNPAVVHHCNLAYLTLGQDFSASSFITGRVPGGTAMKLGNGIAFRIPKGSVVGLQIHYTTTGKPETNRMSVGFNFPRDMVRQELRHLQVTTTKYEIPPGAAAHEVKASRTLAMDATGLGMFAHMHLRGKDMTFVSRPPEGEAETLLAIPNYHYDWQQNYRWQLGTKRFAKGTKIEVTAHFDNSRFNPFNPDPTATVKHGQQTFEEMMFGFFFYTADGEDLALAIDPKTGYVVKE
ncbi:MAG: redoxin family protein [Planctomycetaceae bacterium]|nr:redoxin family protein [Planctomycetaceae bacterium]